MNRLKRGGMIVVDGVYQPQFKKCSCCGNIKPIRLFHKQGKLLRRNKCATCRSIQHREVGLFDKA
jgi:hypothetical protein